MAASFGEKLLREVHTERLDEVCSNIILKHISTFLLRIMRGLDLRVSMLSFAAST
jgi:hypothetical protein